MHIGLSCVFLDKFMQRFYIEIGYKDRVRGVTK